jgi:hypothetical protein
MLRTAAAALTAAALLAAPIQVQADPSPSDSAPAPALTRSQQWRAVAVSALDAYELAPAPTSSQAMVYSNAMLAVGRLYGWDDPRVPGLISAIMATRNADGGWGIGVSWDAFQDGTTNPSTTTYTVALAGHVGPALLEAWRHGALTDPEPLQTITRILVSQTTRLTGSTGQCVVYSRSSYDAGYCVHNVSAGVADYLTQASAAGFGRSGLQQLVVDVTRREVTAYNSAWAGWPYIDGQTVEQDPDHGAYTARSLYFLTYPVGRAGVYSGLSGATTDDNGRRAHLQLPSTPGGPGSQGLVDPSTTLWCEMGDQWLAEAAAYVTSVTGDATRLSQAAAMAAANSIAC